MLGISVGITKASRGGAVVASLKSDVEALRSATETGRTTAGDPLPFVGNAPGDWFRQGSLARGNNTPITFDNLDFIDQEGENLVLYSFNAIDMTVTQCLFGERDFESGGFSYVQPRGDGSQVDVSNCTFYGFDGAGGSDNIIQRYWDTGLFRVTRSRVLNMGGDGFKGGDCDLRENYIGPPKNLPYVPQTYSAATAYVAGDVVYGEGGDSSRLYLARQASTGAALPGGTGTNANWEWYDPHCDVFNNPGGTTYIGYCLVDQPANSDTFAGATNVDRSIRNENSNDSSDVMGVALREGIVSQPWRGVYPIAYGRKDDWSSGRSYSTGDFARRGVRLFKSATDSNQGNDPLTSFSDWTEIIYDNLEGPYVLRHSWIGAGILGDYYFPHLDTTGVAEASREPKPPMVVDNVRDYTTNALVQPPNYAVVEDTTAPTFGVKGTYTPQAWSAEGNSWLVEATGQGRFHTTGGNEVDACVIQIGSSVIAYIEDGQAPTLIPSAYHWTVTDEGSGVYRFECLSLAGARMTGRARVLAGAATITAQTV